MRNFIIGTNVLFTTLFAYTWIDNVISSNSPMTLFFQLMITLFIWAMVDIVLLVIYKVVK